jgi:hypothetical protein
MPDESIHARVEPMLSVNHVLTNRADHEADMGWWESVRAVLCLGGRSDSHHSLRHEVTFAEAG